MTFLEKMGTEVIKTDVLVLGGGIAACHAAIKARESGSNVLLVDKGHIGRSGLSPMMSGVLTHFDPDKDDYDQWYREAVEAGEGLVDQKRLESIIWQTHHRIKEMDNWGVGFQKDQGEYIRMACVGHIYARNVLLTHSGLQLMSVMMGEVIRRGIRVINRVMVTDLLASDGAARTNGAIIGAVGFHVRTGQFYVFAAKAVVIATGSTNSIQPGSLIPVLSGDGRAMAFRAGCEIRNIEIGSYSPVPAGLNCAPGLNILVAEGAWFVNAKGERFMPRWDPARKERAPRAVVSKAIATEEFKGRGPVCLDATHLDNDAYQRIEKCIPIVLASFAAKGLDIRKDEIPYTLKMEDLGPGGIKVDNEYRTSIPGLYAAGAASDHAEDGVSNVISQGMTSLIEGYLAGESAAKHAAEADEPRICQSQVQLLNGQIFAPMKRESGLRHSEVRRHCKSIIEKGLLGPFKNEKGLKEAIDITREIREEEIPRLVATGYHELARAIGLKNELLYLELYPRCALLRTESRGSHMRLDYPQRDDTNWLKWVVARIKDDGDIEVWSKPVPTEEYPLKPNLMQNNKVV